MVGPFGDDEAIKSATSSFAEGSAAATAAGPQAVRGTEDRPAEPHAAGRSPAEEVTGDYKYDLVFDLMRNMRYHADREAWFSGWNRLCQFVSVLSGTAAGATLLSTFGAGTNGAYVAAFLGFLVALITTISLVIDLPGAARAHAGLRQRFAAVLASVELKPLITFGDAAAARAEMARIYGEEPPPKSVVDAKAWNATRRSLATQISKSDLIPIKWHESLLAHVFAFPNFDSRIGGERI